MIVDLNERTLGMAEGNVREGRVEEEKAEPLGGGKSRILAGKSEIENQGANSPNSGAKVTCRRTSPELI
jgi:hypothetical protein